LTDFHNSFNDVLSWKFAIKLIKIPPHLGCVATLPCEIFQQDSAPAHRARETIKLLQRETHAFISPDLWPPNSSDLNPIGQYLAKMWTRVSCLPFLTHGVVYWMQIATIFSSSNFC